MSETASPYSYIIIIIVIIIYIYIIMFSSCNSGRNLTIYSTAVLLGSGLDPENNYSTQM